MPTECGHAFFGFLPRSVILGFAGGGLSGYLANKGAGIAGDYAAHGRLQGGAAHALTPDEYAEQHPRFAQPFRADHYEPAQRSAELQQQPRLDPHEVGHGVASALSGRTLRVEVVNVVQTSGGGAGPGVDEAARSPDPRHPRGYHR